MAQFRNIHPFRVVGGVVPPNSRVDRFPATATKAPTSGLVPGARFDNTAMYAFVLEDEPVGPDSRLVWESFPAEGLEETYALAAYREMGGNRMPQPAFATYQGGNWQPIPIALNFRAGVNQRNVTGALAIDQTDLDRILLEMERKVNWLEALGFPLERRNLEARRVLQRSTTTRNVPASAVSTEQFGKLKRNDPPFVLMIWGTWKIIRGYLTNIVISWQPPYHPISGRPYGATVRMQFQPIMPEYPTWQSIRNQAGTAGLSGAITRRLPAADRDRIARSNARIAGAAAVDRARQGVFTALGGLGG